MRLRQHRRVSADRERVTVCLRASEPSHLSRPSLAPASPGSPKHPTTQGTSRRHTKEPLASNPSTDHDPFDRRAKLSEVAGTALGSGTASPSAPRLGPCTRPRTGRCRGRPADPAALGGRVKTSHAALVSSGGGGAV